MKSPANVLKNLHFDMICQIKKGDLMDRPFKINEKLISSYPRTIL